MMLAMRRGCGPRRPAPASRLWRGALSRPLLLALSLTALRAPSLRAQAGPHDSGGPLIPEQAAFDVTFYDIALRVEPADSTIAGRVTTVARITAPTSWLVLDLDPALGIDSVVSAAGPGERRPLAFERRGGKLWIRLPEAKRPGESVAVEVAYGGRPRVAPNPPWDGGFTWARTRDGRPWIATSNQSNGPDLWWPSKDHVSDKPDSVALHITAPADLVVATNGRLRERSDHPDGTRTWHWFVSTPISAYNIALNIAPYRPIEGSYTSVSGEAVPVVFYVLEEDYERGRAFFPEILEHLRWFEETLGPYPFRRDKYGVAQTPHLGMEHQTITAYGAGFNNAAMTGRDWGFDALHHHELSHEWWGNLVTNADWRDMWLHEGFGSYMQPLYAEKLRGPEAYHAYMASLRRRIRDLLPIAPRQSRTAREIYQASIYDKGAWVLHTLRYLVGEDALRQTLRRMAYPDPALERRSDGSPARHATTDDFVRIAEEVSGRELGWFFEVYLRQAPLPKLVTERQGERLTLRWEAPGGLAFPMPVEVRVGERVRRVEMPDGRATITVPRGQEVAVDPMGWILKEESAS